LVSKSQKVWCEVSGGLKKWITKWPFKLYKTVSGVPKGGQRGVTCPGRQIGLTEKNIVPTILQ